MKKLLFTVMVSFGILGLNAQITFQKTYGGTKDEAAYYVQQTTDDGYILCGYTQSSASNTDGSQDAYILKTDKNGITQWSYISNVPQDQHLRYITQTSDGGYIASGASWDSNKSGWNVIIVRLDNTGQVVWTKTLSNNLFSNYGYQIKQTLDGTGFIMAGWLSSNPNARQADAYLVRFDLQGVIQWQFDFADKWYNTGSATVHAFTSFEELANGDIIAAGYSQSLENGTSGNAQGALVAAQLHDYFIVRTNSNGSMLNFFEAGTNDYDAILGIKKAPNSNDVYICGISGPSSPVSRSASFAKIDLNLNTNSIVWSTRIPIPLANSDASSPGFNLTTNGDIISTVLNSPANNNNDGNMVLLNPNTGNLIWNKNYGGVSDDGLSIASQTTDGGFIAVGYTKSFGQGGKDIFIVKTDINGNVPDLSCTPPNPITLTANHPAFIADNRRPLVHSNQLTEGQLPNPTDMLLPTAGITCQTCTVSVTTSNNTICTGSSTTLTATAANSYSWEPSTGLNTTTTVTVVATPSVTTTYTVTATKNCGIVTSTVTVIVSNCSQTIPSTASFTAPDTVCVNQSFSVTNTSSNASTYYWNFCSGNVNTTPITSNMGNIGGLMDLPVYTKVLKQGNNYYMFVTNNKPGTTKSLVRLDFGNSLSNTPTTVNLGNPNNALPAGYLEDFYIQNENGNYYGVAIGGFIGGGGGVNSQRIVKLDFGNSLTNTPTATNWGNVGNWGYPKDLEIFQQGASFYGFILDANNNTISRLNFGSSISNQPTSINLTSVSGLSSPGGISIVNYQNNWYGYIVNQGDNSITRLDFGSSLLNAPIATKVNNPGALNGPSSISIFPDCGGLSGLIGNYPSNDLVTLNFPNGATGKIVTISQGNNANFNYPHSIERVRSGDSLFAFIPNARNNSISRVAYVSCTNASIPSSNLQTPPSISYNSPGVYNITLSTDETLITQSDACKQVVVISTPTVTVNSASICLGASVTLTANGATTYSWLPATGLNTTTGTSVVATPTLTTTYTITGTNNYCNTVAYSTVTVFNAPVINVNSATICSGATTTLTATGANTYSWSPAIGLNTTTGASVIASPTVTTTYTVTTGSSTSGLGPELVYNGDFSMGNTGFTNDYNFVASQSSGNFFIGNDYFKNSVTSAYPDRTSPGVGKYAVFDGLTRISKVWEQTITTIAQNQAYQFSYWANRGDISSSGKLAHFEVHFIGDVTGDIVVSNETVLGIKPWNLIWDEYSKITWNSLGNNRVTIQIIDLETNSFGNDVAIDDISLRPLNTGCTDTAVSTVTVNQLPTITVNSTSICLGASATLTASGADTYNWLPVAGLNTTTGASVIATPTLTTTYTIIGTNNCGNDTAVSTVTVNPLPTIMVNSTSICLGASATLTASGADTYKWLPTAGLNTTTGASVIATPTLTTTYTITGTNNCGNDTAVSIVTVNQLPTIAVNSTSICLGTSATLTASGADIYNWLPTAGLNTTTGTSVIATPTLTTTYTITGTNNCGNDTAVSIVTVNQLPTITVNSTSICLGASATLTANGADTYNWLPTAGLNTTTGASVIATPTLTTTYTITGTNNCGNDTAISTVTVNPLPTTTVNSASICLGASATLTANGADTYRWLPTAGLNTTTGASVIATPTLTTTYTITGTNNCGTNTALSTVTVFNVPVINVNSGTICAGTTYILAANGANTYTWSPTTGLNSSTGATVSATPLNTTTYSVIGTNTSGCTNSATASVTIISPYVITVNSATICSGDSILLIAKGTNAYSWVSTSTVNNTSSSTITVSPTITTTYSVTGTDGCASNTAISKVLVHPPPSARLISKNIGCEALEAVIRGRGGNPPYTFTYQINGVKQSPVNTKDSSNTIDLSQQEIAFGTYTYSLVGVKDAYNCYSSITNEVSTINVYQKPSAVFTVEPEKANMLNSSILVKDASIGGYNWLWNFGDGHQSYSKDPGNHMYADTGRYRIKLITTTKYGCADSTYHSVIITLPFTIYIPNAFTPAVPDGINDTFTPKGEGILNYEMDIYSRWGERIFHTNDLNTGWDGKAANGGDEIAKMDTYIYVINIKAATNKHDYTYRGTVSLIR